MLVSSGLLAYGDASSAPVRAHILLTRIQTDPLALALRRHRDRLGRLLPGRGSPPGQTRPELVAVGHCRLRIGVAAVWIAVGSGLATYDEVNVALHVVQHLILMMVAPPLIALGKPITLVSQPSHRQAQVDLRKAVHSRT